MTTVPGADWVPPYIPYWPWWKRDGFEHVERGCGCTFCTVTFLSIAVTILKLITKRNYSVISPVLSGPCSKFGATWSGRKAPKSCRVLLGPTERQRLAGAVCICTSCWKAGAPASPGCASSPQTSCPFMLSRPLPAADSPRVSVPFIFSEQICISPSRDNKNVALLISECKYGFRVVTHRQALNKCIW